MKFYSVPKSEKYMRKDIVYFGRERRLFPRLKSHIAVTYKVNEPLTAYMHLEGKEITAIALDLGEAGIAISTNYNIPFNSFLLIKFTIFKIGLDNRSAFYGPMLIRGDVRHSTLLEGNTHRIGICFTRIEESDKIEIANFVKMMRR